MHLNLPITILKIISKSKFLKVKEIRNLGDYFNIRVKSYYIFIEIIVKKMFQQLSGKNYKKFYNGKRSNMSKII